MADAVRLKGVLRHTGLLLPVVGAATPAFTATVIVSGWLVQPFAVAVTLYKPAAATVALAIVGFCWVEVNPFGPVHAKVAPVVGKVAVSFREFPAQSGTLTLATGVAGAAETVTLVLAGKLAQPLMVAVTV